MQASRSLRIKFPRTIYSSSPSSQITNPVSQPFLQGKESILTCHHTLADASYLGFPQVSHLAVCPHPQIPPKVPCSKHSDPLLLQRAFQTICHVAHSPPSLSVLTSSSRPPEEGSRCGVEWPQAVYLRNSKLSQSVRE